MSRLKQFILGLRAREDGPTAVEYAIMMALIIIACITAIQSIGAKIDETAEAASSALITPE